MRTRPIPMLALTAVVLAGLAGLTGCGDSATATTASTPTATVTVTVRPTPAPVTSPNASPNTSTTLGPDGYGGVRLGMTATQARRAGATVSDDGPGAACDGLRLPGTTAPKGAVDGWVSRQVGVAMIGAPNAGATTPEGIHAGSSRTEVEAAYPDATGSPDYWSVAVAGHPGASYWWNYDERGRVDMLALVLDTQDCAN